MILMLPVSLAIETSFNLSYDPNGNLVQDTDKYYEYNSLNQLARVRENSQNGRILEEYAYDYGGDRVKKVSYDENNAPTTTYYIDENFVRVVNSSGTYDTKFYYNNGQLIARQDPDGKRYYYHPDHLGSTNIVTDQNGNIVEETSYEPFGAVIEGGESRFTFTGKEKDPTGLMYFGARYYSPALMKFTQPDTILQNVYDPQLLNRYSYVRNNPLKYTDPSGHILDTIFDVGFIIWDIVDIVRKPLEWSNWAGLGGDVVGLFVPFVTGVGRGIKIAAHAAKAADKAKDAVRIAGKANDIKKVTKATGKVNDVTKAVRKGEEIASKAVSNTKGLQHAYDKHATELGLDMFSGKSWKKERELWKEFNKNIIANSDKTFSHTLGGNKVRGYYKKVNGADIAVFVYEEGKYKGGLASTLKLSKEQMKKFRLK
ncbi:MAG: RHS repeat-associated core domain-containing protein [Candidatus Woesearchaeota archaeon]|nr:RHS repeat-associated core domain-containing protein [Candidatus Woesearchaeota archaeon]